MLDYEIQDDWIRLLLLSPYWKEKSFELNPGMDPLRHGALMTNIITKVADGSSFARASACVGLGPSRNAEKNLAFKVELFQQAFKSRFSFKAAGSASRSFVTRLPILNSNLLLHFQSHFSLFLLSYIHPVIKKKNFLPNTEHYSNTANQSF